MTTACAGAVEGLSLQQSYVQLPQDFCTGRDDGFLTLYLYLNLKHVLPRYKARSSVALHVIKSRGMLVTVVVCCRERKVVMIFQNNFYRSFTN